MPRRKNKNYIFSGKLIFILTLILVCILALAGMLKFFFTRSSYFAITKVTLEGIEQDAFLEFKKRLLGKNIFLQELKAIKEQVEESSDIECIAISRRLPGELVFYLRKRISVAQLKLARYHLIDQAGILISGASSLAYDNLPIILGIEMKTPQRKTPPYPGTELYRALELIKEKNNSSALANYRIAKIYVLGAAKTSSFVILENFSTSGLLKKDTPTRQLEIKFDLEKPGDTIRVLGALLDKLQASSHSQGVRPLENIEYLDLRNIDSPVVMEKKTKP